ncbi:MAG: alanine--tRNA ligase [Negativicutes bacterium]|jgi:alanyl-tRNA synthetase
MTGNELRKKYLDFFKSKQHLIQSSYSLIPHDDPTLLIVAAGMAPLKPFFTGKMTPPSPRIATCQKCVRTNDIENVGYTARHHTFFEMLGNFSFGDYFKVEAIEWAWEFVTKHLQLDPNRIYPSVYEEDDEAYDIWRDKIGIPEARIVRLGKKDNFWEIGPGPCGPCSELYYDMGEEFGCGNENCFVGCDCDRYLEFWNLVFTQFDRQEDGSYLPLAKKNIDTGAGLERLASIMQHKRSNFETDLVFPIIQYVEKISGMCFGKDGKNDISMKVIADHGRSMVVMIGDGILPSNEGRGYVLRRILRRAIRHGKLLGINNSFMLPLVDVVAGIFAEPYPEIGKNIDFIKKIVENEENRFNETLHQGTELLIKIIAEQKQAGGAVILGADVFRLYDTYGFPWELTMEIAAEQGMSIDQNGFSVAMEEQRNRARTARVDVATTDGIPDLTKIVNQPTEYNKEYSEAKILAIFKAGQLLDVAVDGSEVALVLDKTAFYAEGGGQVCDKGFINSADGQFVIRLVKKLPDGTVAHFGQVVTGKFALNATVTMLPDCDLRMAAARNHTATHILHSVLKNVLGNHVNQAGSLVSPERLRFDFSHFEQIKPEQLSEIEFLVNQRILAGDSVKINNMSIADAKASGATALFGEKYGDIVRVVRIGDYSKEFCGGNHVDVSGEIGLFKILSEESVAAGVRRIEAVTGMAAVDYVQRQNIILNKISDALKVGTDSLVERIGSLQEKTKELEKTIAKLNRKLVGNQLEDLCNAAVSVGALSYVVAEVSVPDVESLRELGDSVKNKLENCIVVLGAKIADKLSFLALVQGAALKCAHAGKIIQETARIAGGNGGGKPEMAQAGGKLPEKLGEALAAARTIIAKQTIGGENE